ncbi:MAG: GFA family protein [Alphaproteobacteria bacterium]
MTEHTGGCLCGAVRFTVVGQPERVALCHCATCRKNTGAPYFAFAVFTTGRATIEGALKSFRAPTIERRFCPRCGSLICLEEDGNGEIDIALGAFDEPLAFAPQYELWVGNRPDWLSAVPGARQYAGNRDATP